jgi:hypothetical protein
MGSLSVIRAKVGSPTTVPVASGRSISLRGDHQHCEKQDHGQNDDKISDHSVAVNRFRALRSERADALVSDGAASAAAFAGDDFPALGIAEKLLPTLVANRHRGSSGLCSGLSAAVACSNR